MFQASSILIFISIIFATFGGTFRGKLWLLVKAIADIIIYNLFCCFLTLCFIISSTRKLTTRMNYKIIMFINHLECIAENYRYLLTKSNLPTNFEQVLRMLCFWNIL